MSLKSKIIYLVNFSKIKVLSNGKANTTRNYGWLASSQDKRSNFVFIYLPFYIILYTYVCIWLEKIKYDLLWNKCKYKRLIQHVHQTLKKLSSRVELRKPKIIWIIIKPERKLPKRLFKLYENVE